MNTMTAEIRNPSAKVRQLRRSGIIPCVIYGGSLTESLLIQTDRNTAKKLLRCKREGSKIEIVLDGSTIIAQIKDVALDFVTKELDHISFQALDAGKKVNSKARIVLLNKDLTLGILEQMLFEIPYSAFPGDMIETITVNLADFGIGSIMTAKDLDAFNNENIDLLVDGDTMIFKISDRKRTQSAAV